MEFIIFIPWGFIVAVALILLGLIGAGLQVLPTIMFWTFTILYFFFWLIFPLRLMYKSDAEGKDISIKSVIILSIISTIGFIVSIYVINVFTDIGAEGYKTLLALLLGATIIELVIGFIPIGVVNSIAAFLLLTIMCIWTIGFDLGYQAKRSPNNVAYYKCTEIVTESMFGKSFHSVEEMNNWKPSQLNGNIFDDYGLEPDEQGGHVIGTYKEGDTFVPYIDQEGMEQDNVLSDYDVWGYYPVVTSSGQIGYIPTMGATVYYNRYSDAITARQHEIAEDRWYGFLPDSFLRFCVKFFEIDSHKYAVKFG